MTPTSTRPSFEGGGVGDEDAAGCVGRARRALDLGLGQVHVGGAAVRGRPRRKKGGSTMNAQVDAEGAEQRCANGATSECWSGLRVPPATITLQRGIPRLERRGRS